MFIAPPGARCLLPGNLAWNNAEARFTLASAFVLLHRFRFFEELTAR